NILESFRPLISAETWCQSLLSSIPVVKNESELIEILHSLLLLTYKLPEASIPPLLTYFCSSPQTLSGFRSSASLKQAEGALMSSTLLVAGLTDCCSSVVPTSSFSPLIQDFLTKNFENLVLNPFNIAPVFASYSLFAKNDPELSSKLTNIPHKIPSSVFDAMATLTSTYSKGSVSDRHSLSLIVSSSVFETFEALLSNFDGSHFGNKSQGFKILARILQHSSISENFLCGHPPALTELYTEATSRFPLDVGSTLMIWKSLCLSVKNKEDCNILMNGLARMNCVAEFEEDDAVHLFTRKTGASEYLNLKTRRIFGTEVEKGARGTLNEDGAGIPFISWEITSNSNAFCAIRAIIEPVAQFLAENKVEEPAELDYLPEIVFSVAEFVISFMNKAEKPVDEVNFLVHPVCIILGRMITISRDTEEKGRLVKSLLGIVAAVNEFLEEKILLFNYVYEGLPGGGRETVMNEIENIILREESVKMTNGEVTLALLELLSSFAELDTLVESGLVPVLSAHLRHRLNPSLPTLSVMILRQIAEYSDIPLSLTSFRDILTQRLELLAEDINLKIAVLDFLTISFQTQQGFYARDDSNLEKTVLELISYKNPELSSACLKFLLGLFRRKAPLASKTIQGFWEKILSPINNLEGKAGAEIVASTLHILIFELYQNELAEPQLSYVLEEFLKQGKIQLVVKTILEETTGEQPIKSLTALKHFLLLILGRVELTSKLVTGEVLNSLRQLIVDNLWETCEESERRSKLLVELLTILTTGESCSAPFLAELLLKLMETFKFLSFSVKLSMLCLLNKCFRYWKPQETQGIIENALRIINSISKNSSINLEDLMGNPETSGILGMSSTLLKTIIESQPFSVWGAPFQQDLVVLGLLSIACVGIKLEKAPFVVSSALAALIALSEDPEGFKLLPTRGMSSLWLHLHKFTISVDPTKKEWEGVFMLCLNLNSKLLQSLKRDYLEEALGFWGLFGNFLNGKLGEMLNLTEIWLRGNGKEDIKLVISTSIFTLNGILSLMPYLEDWQKSQRVEVFKGIRAVFQAFQEALRLLRQPLLLNSSKEEGKLVELQLWTLSDLATNILLKLKGKQEEFLEKGTLISTMFQVGQLCIMVLSSKNKPGEVVGRVFAVLEKVMLIIHNLTVPLLQDPTRDLKLQVGFRREYGTEVVSLIDGIRRLSTPKTDFLANICTKMESKFK
ncbi:hypothetical protein Ocin01_14477, partial [Orchesella cincta]